MRNKYNTFIEIDNVDERMGVLIYLHTIGYKVMNIENLGGLYHMCKLNKFITIHDVFVTVDSFGDDVDLNKFVDTMNNNGYYKNEFVLSENVEQFKSISKLTDENDKNQWFYYVDDKGEEFWYICNHNDHKVCFSAWEKRTMIKADVNKIKEHF